MENKSLGEKRVRVDFNVGNSTIVNDIKVLAANFINAVNSIPMPVFKEEDKESVGEFNRLKAKAMTDIEQGAMWAVKAATL